MIVVWVWISWNGVYKLTHRVTFPYEEVLYSGVMNEDIEKISIETSDSVTIKGIMGYYREDRPIFLLLHGNGGDYAGNSELIDSLYSNNYNFLAISLRCHGSSGGELNDIGYSARHDVIATVNYIKEMNDSAKIIIVGRSLGAAAAIFASGEINSNVLGYILESPYYDLKEAVRNRLELYLPGVVSDLAYWNVLFFSNIYLEDLSAISPYDSAKNLPVDKPVVFLAGEEDKRAPLKDILSISSRVQGSEVVIFNGAKHESLFRYDADKYLEQIERVVGSISINK